MSPAPQTSPSPKLLARGFGSLLFANAFFGYGFSCFFLLPKYMAQVLGAGPDQVGHVAALNGGVVVLTLPFIGAAVDRYGRRGFLTGGGVLMAAASLCYGAVDSVGPLLYALRIAQGLAFSMVFAAGGALAIDLAPPGRMGQAIGVYGLSYLSMNAVAPATVEIVAVRVGWEIAFATAAASAALCALLSRRIRDPWEPAAPDAPRAGLRALAMRPATQRILLVIALVGSAMSAVFAYHQLYAIELGFERVSSFFIAYASVAIVVRAGFGHYMDRWGHRRVATWALALYTLVVLGVAALPVFGLVVLGGGLGLAHGVFYPSFNAVAIGAARPDESGRMMALFQSAFQVGMTLGALGFGALAASRGYPLVFVAAAAGLLLALLLLLTWRDQESRST